MKENFWTKHYRVAYIKELILKILYTIIGYVIFNCILSLFCLSCGKYGDVLSNMLACSTGDMDIPYLVKLIKLFSNIICSAVIGGFLYSFIVNYPPSIAFHPNLIVRQSKTETDPQKKDCVSVIIGKEWKYANIYNIHCQFVFKTEKNYPLYVTDSLECDGLPIINNFYRFSAPIKPVAKDFWRHLGADNEKSSANDDNKDYVIVLISGIRDYYGGQFCIKKIYQPKDIIFNNDEPNIIIENGKSIQKSISDCKFIHVDGELEEDFNLENQDYWKKIFFENYSSEVSDK